MIRFSAIALLVCFSIGTSARAQEDVLRAVDELTAANRCEAALALLAHATGTPAEIAGRRGLCEAMLGRSAEAATHIGEALQSASDPWVTANRARMLAALSAPAAPSTSVPMDVVPPPAPVEPEAPPVVAIARPQQTIDEGFLARFGNAPSDQPRARVPYRVNGSRFILRAGVAAGAVVTSTPWRNGYRGREEGTRGDENAVGELSYVYGYDGSNERPSFRTGVGFEAEYIALGRLSLVGGFELGLTRGTLEDGRAETRIRYDASGSNPRLDRASGDIEWGTGFSFRATVAARLHLKSGHVFVGGGARVGLLRVRGHADLYDVWDDDDNRLSGTREGEMSFWMGGNTVETVLDAGVAMGRRRDVLAFARFGLGVPLFTAELFLQVPLVRSAP